MDITAGLDKLFRGHLGAEKKENRNLQSTDCPVQSVPEIRVCNLGNEVVNGFGMSPAGRPKNIPDLTPDRNPLNFDDLMFKELVLIIYIDDENIFGYLYIVPKGLRKYR